MSAEWIREADGAAGWFERGRCDARAVGGADYWAQAARVSVRALGRNVDTVNTLRAVICVGPFAANPVDGSLVRLLARLPREVLVKHLGRVSEESGLGLATDPPGFTIGFRSADLDSIRAAFALGSTPLQWSAGGMWRAKAWTDGFAAVLADEACRRSLGLAFGETTREVAAKLALPWEPRTVDGQRALATVTAFARVHERGAAALARQVGPAPDALLAAAARPGAWPAQFAAIAPRMRGALALETWGGAGA